MCTTVKEERLQMIQMIDYCSYIFALVVVSLFGLAAIFSQYQERHIQLTPVTRFPLLTATHICLHQSVHAFFCRGGTESGHVGK